MNWIIILIAVIALIAIGGFLWWGFKKALILALNSVIGFFALYAVAIFRPELVINFWSVIITALGGIFGFLIVIILHFLGWAF
ncbi:transcriptional regulator [Candidatus Woesearchaeota archaeon]|nr:transcriptional regulator [Candidatus Woesearchaeota archaeon]